MSNKLSFISGNFNVIHSGHIRLFKFAKSLSKKLIIGLYSDETASESVFVNEELRKESLKEINLIDEVIIIKKDLKETINEIKPDYIVKGLEFQSTNNIEHEIIKGTKCQLVFSSGESNLLSNRVFDERNNNYLKLPQNFLNRYKINKKKIISTINDFNKLRVLVIGDLIVDEYVECLPIGMSKETNNIVYNFEKKTKYLGGAGIVAAHTSALGARVTLISNCGKDEDGKFILEKLQEYNIKSNIIITDIDNTIKKTRFNFDNVNLFRLNYLNKNLLNKKLSNKIFNEFNKLKNNLDLVIFSDFNYGFLDEELISKIMKICDQNNIMVTADSQTSSQYGDIGQYQNSHLITPTELEARSTLNDNKSGLVVLLEKLRKKTNVKNIILTQGKDGLIIHHYDEKKKVHSNDTLSALNEKPLNISGAGDALLVGSSCALKVTNNIWLSALIGNIMSAIQISKEGNVPIELNTLLRKVEDS
jgi:rfaE bifunctional protein kinase chain/domain